MPNWYSSISDLELLIMKRREKATRRNISISCLLREIGVSSGVVVLVYLSPYNYFFLSTLLITIVFPPLSTLISESVLRRVGKELEKSSGPTLIVAEGGSDQEEVEVSSDLSRSDEYRQISSHEDSISDDESFIEITFPHGHNIDPKESQPMLEPKKKSSSSNTTTYNEILPLEILFRKYGLLELLSEINDEDNWIEINFTMGSCSSIVCHG